MIFYLHYILMTSGLSGVSVLLAVYFREYSDASESEIGALLMSFPFVGLIIKPLFCSMADRRQAHKLYLLLGLIVELIGYSPFAIIPMFPKFYQNYPRCSWYILVAACHIGNGGLGVAWSLGDCLAMNMSQKNGTPFGRMRLMGTISWGVYGFIIGQINEVPMLPKYTPAFLILHLSLIIEIAMVFCWTNEDFIMIDPLAAAATQPPLANDKEKQQQQQQPSQLAAIEPAGDSATDQHPQLIENFINSTPSSLGGTLRMKANVAGAFRDVFASADLTKKLKTIDNDGEREDSNNKNDNLELGVTVGGGGSDLVIATRQKSVDVNVKQKNPQLILFKMILLEDGRLLKYICLFTIFGFIMAPMNFLFLSMEEVCRKRGYNFSQLAGAILISQATIETIGFLVVPWLLAYVSRSIAMSFTYLIMGARYIFYAGWYYNSNVSPYWGVIGEWGHGFGYGIFCTIQADVALMFANQSRLFIPELRRLGYLSQVDENTPKELIEAEEKSIKMALRATMQALFDGFMSGLGMGVGALVCGIFVELYNYITLWQLFYIISIGSLVIHQLVEVSKCRWSDTYKPRKGTKAYEIKQLQKSMANSAKEDDGASDSTGKIISNVKQRQESSKPAECC